MRVRRALVWFIPSKVLRALPEDAEAAWCAIEAEMREPPDDFVPLDWADAARADRSSAGAYQQMPEPSRVTPLLPPAYDDVQRLVGPEPFALVRVESGWSKSVRGLSREQLARGVLIGRYSRCGFEIAAGDAGVSRVHVLLARVGGRTYAIDTASTNGVVRGGRRVTVAAVESGEVLQLGGTTRLSVRWRERPAELAN